MKKSGPFLFLFLCAQLLWGQTNLEIQKDEFEVRLPAQKQVNAHVQQTLRLSTAWQHFLSDHPGWMVHFDEQTQLPHRAYGPPMETSQDPNVVKADLLNYFTTGMNITSSSFQENKMAGSTVYRAQQLYQGLEVLYSLIELRFKNEQLHLFGLDLYAIENLSIVPDISADAAITVAKSNLPGVLVSSYALPELKVLPLRGEHTFQFHLVFEVKVKTKNEIGIPQHYRCYVDAHTGDLLYRVNQVRHLDHKGEEFHPPLLVVDVNVASTYYLTSPWDPVVNGVLPNLQVTVNGTNYFTDANGNVTIPVTGPVNAQITLQGPWARVYTGTTTPSFSATLLDGSNSITFDNNANVKERSAYRSVQDIHDHMKFWMPNFTGMDFQLPTNIDVTGGDCNAFYDGTSINFYDLANGCNASSNVPDVAYHEYGHGINDNYYQSMGSFFNNGAMGEAYADFWAISLTNNPILGSGFYVANQDPIRRYDIDPKVYPMDLVGEVHQDGEILMGAWWDTHLLMGGDWNLTMPIFLGAYSGLQAVAADGSEGQAYTDVLIDALMADDNDGDITNGTPNGNAIVQGFYLHGITLITNAVINHAPADFAPANQGLPIEAQLDLTFPYLSYLQDVVLNYKINNGSWQQVAMIDQGSEVFLATIDAQPLATVVSYFITTHDINGNTGTVQPNGAHLALYPNLPHITLIGVTQQAIQDCDNNENWGAWTMGVPGDNATTGIWTLDTPIASYNVDVAPDVAVQTGTQTTPGGEYCFFTGNALPTDGIGVNDVDGGATTLQSPTIDMSTFSHPVVSYNRWYTNSPPSGANPGADWFQVKASNDNGQTWIYIENTSTTDMSWRRNAFRVEDYLTPTSQMKFRFIASDSLHPELNLSGGSLVEAAMDDFTLYDEYIPQTITEIPVSNLMIYPNPTSDVTTIQLKPNEAGEFLIYNATGELIIRYPSVTGKLELNTQLWSSGIYEVIWRGAHQIYTERLVIKR
jgi:Secretion system C-terminal sorting domain